VRAVPRCESVTYVLLVPDSSGFSNALSRTKIKTAIYVC